MVEVVLVVVLVVPQMGYLRVIHNLMELEDPVLMMHLVVMEVQILSLLTLDRNYFNVVVQSL